MSEPSRPGADRVAALRARIASVEEELAHLREELAAEPVPTPEEEPRGATVELKWLLVAVAAIWLGLALLQPAVEPAESAPEAPLAPDAPLPEPPDLSPLDAPP